MSELENAQERFRFSIAQRMLYNDESSKKRTISSLAEQRHQITSLSPQQNPSVKRQKVDTSYENNSYQNYHDPSTSSTLQPTIAPVVQQTMKFTYENGFQATNNFCNYAQNSHEPWDAPLTIEEPFDPSVISRVHYRKNHVYPGNGQEYSPEEIKADKYHKMMDEKRKAEELRKRQEQELLRQQAEAKRLLEEQERLRVQQQNNQQQQQQNYHNYHQQNHQNSHSWNQQQQQPSNNYNSYYQQHNDNNSQYSSYSHDHMYQSHHHQQQYNSYQNSPQNHTYQNSPQHQTYQNSPQHQSYQNSPHHQQSVIVNRNQYENNDQTAYQQQQQHAYHYQHQGYQQNSPQIHQQQNYQNSPHSYMNQQQQHGHQNQHHNQNMQNHTYQGQQNYNNYSNQNQYYSTNHYPTHYQNQSYVNNQQPQQQQHNWNLNKQVPSSHYQDVEYLIDDQNEIDPKMLQQPIVENINYKKNVENEESEEEYAGPAPIVRSYMLDDLEDQIEASTISFSSNGKSRNKKITIKFRKEKTTNQMTIVKSENAEFRNCLEPSSTSSSSSGEKRKLEKHRINNDLIDDNTQFMPSGTNSSSSLVNHGEYDSFGGKLSFNGCVPKKSNKISTPISTFKSLRKPESVRSQNDDSICSLSGEPNSFFQAENDEEFRKGRLEKALSFIEEQMKKKTDIDPFNAELCRSFLVKLNFPNRDSNEGYKISNVNLPKLIKNHSVAIGGDTYQIEKEVGRGAFGAVFRGVNTNDGSVVAMKYQKPPNSWELYICTEVKKRLKNPDIVRNFNFYFNSNFN